MRRLFSAKNKIHLELIFVLLLFLFGVCFTFYQNVRLSREFHLSLLASSFLQGRTDIQEAPEKYIDSVRAEDGRYYFWHEPLGAVLMAPFVLVLGSRAPQGFLAILVTLVNIFLVNKILSANEETKRLLLRMWFLAIYFFASGTVSLIFSPNSWYLIQNLGITFVLWSLWEWRTKRRPFWIFLTMLLLVLTRRNMAYFLGFYYFVDIILEKMEKKEQGEKGGKKIRPILAAFFAGVIGSIFLTWYFGLGFPKGGLQEFSGDSLRNVRTDMAQLEKAERGGLWNLTNVPTHLVKFFLLGPEIVKENSDANANLSWPYLYPRQDGISFFFLSPIFLSLLFLPILKKKEFWAISGAAFVWALIYLPYFASGSAQFGARYAAELVPFLFLILIEVLPPYFGFRAKIITVFSVFLNAFLFMAMTSLGYLTR